MACAILHTMSTEPFVFFNVCLARPFVSTLSCRMVKGCTYNVLGARSIHIRVEHNNSPIFASSSHDVALFQAANRKD